VLVALPGILIVMLALTLREPVRRENVTLGSRVRFADTVAYVRRHWIAYLTLTSGAAVSSVASYAMYSWVPALFDRQFA